jgi:hypothetical protein
MHTVAETEAYLATARRAGMTAREMEAAVALVSANPAAGDLIVGSGGCRKVRLAGRGKGKSGGYRIVTYYWRETSPVYLIAALSKGSAGDFSQAQVAAMAQAAKRIAAASEDET